MTQVQINYLCKVIRNDFDNSSFSYGTAVENLTNARLIFAKLEIQNEQEVIDLLRGIESDIKFENER